MTFAASYAVPVAHAATAEPLPGLFNTGVDANGVPLGNLAIDPHYQLIGSADPAYAGPSTYACNPIAGGYWLPNNSVSRWIGPAPNEGYPTGAPSHPGGSYTYRIAFDLTGFDPATVHLTGGWCADNSGSGMRLNGQATGVGAGGYSSLAPFDITTGFVNGINTLDFVVSNLASSGSNPTGLRVQGLAGTAMPALVGVGADEPPAFALSAPVPNPSFRSARLGYTLPHPGHVRLSIRSVAGREVRRLVDRDVAAGHAETAWDGITDGGATAVPGVYLAVLECAGRTTSRRLVWLR
jgi:hypothetical protein